MVRTYIHKQSNHPPSIIKTLPKSINKRLSTNSKNAQIFNEACPPYTEALKRMDTTQIYNLIRRVQNEKAENLPYNINVATNVVKTFLTLIDKHFPKKKKAKQNLQ